MITAPSRIRAACCPPVGAGIVGILSVGSVGSSGSVTFGSVGSGGGAGNGGGNGGMVGNVGSVGSVVRVGSDGSVGIGIVIGLRGSNGALRLTAKAPATPTSASSPPPETASALKFEMPSPPSRASTWIDAASTVPAMDASVSWLLTLIAAATPSEVAELTADPLANASASPSNSAMTVRAPTAERSAPSPTRATAVLKSKFSAMAAAAPTAPSAVPTRSGATRSWTLAGVPTNSLCSGSEFEVGSRLIGLIPVSASLRELCNRIVFSSTTRT